MSDDNFEKIRREFIFEQVSKTIKENPKNWAKRLEELGFQWFDDENDEEEAEEAVAKPDNSNQELLVAYFESYNNLSDQVLNSFLTERASANPNYPLIRKYFKRGNENLKRLLIYGLEKNPTDIGLLNDLGFFHEFKNILSELIQLYLKACEEEEGMNKFEELVLNFYFDTEPDGFDAFCELEQQVAPDSDKAKILQKIRQEQKLESDLVVKF